MRDANITVSTVDPPLRILVVDGEEQVRTLLRIILARVGHEVYAVRTAEEAIQRWGASMEFDAVVCEILLPGMDGHEFAKTITRIRPGRRVIFVSSSGAHCEECPHSPVCPLILKPFDPDELIRAVAETGRPES